VLNVYKFFVHRLFQTSRFAGGVKSTGVLRDFILRNYSGEGEVSRSTSYADETKKARRLRHMASQIAQITLITLIFAPKFPFNQCFLRLGSGRF
jgi:hypothetical protein